MDFIDIYPGDHIFYSCGAYDHHGIYCGNVPYGNRLYKDVVIHFQSKHKEGTIRGISYKKFIKGQEIYVAQYQAGSCYEPDEVVNRAISKLNEHGYDFLSNNCEHFAQWCKTGQKVSDQINTVKWVGGTLAGGAVAAVLLPLAIPELIGIGIWAAARYIGGKFISGLFKV